MAELLNSSATTVTCPYFSLSDDGNETKEHEFDSLDLIASRGKNFVFHQCSTCRHWCEQCPGCGSLNRLVSRHCRQCGARFVDRSWTAPEGGLESWLGSQTIGAPQTPTVATLAARAASLEEASGSSTGSNEPKALLCQSGVAVLVMNTGGLTLWLDGRFLCDIPYPMAHSSRVISAGLWQGCAVLATSEKLWVLDLVDALGASHGSPNRRKSLSLRGQLAAPLAVTQSAVCCYTQDRQESLLQVFSHAPANPTRLQLSWTQVVESSDSGSVWLSCLGNSLLFARESGELRMVSVDTGQWSEPILLPTGLAYLSPQARVVRNQPSWVVAASDGSIFAVAYRNSQLDLTPLAPSCKESIFGFGSNSEEIVCCHGKLIRRIDLLSGKLFELEVPQYCAGSPWVCKNRALVVSQEGTLYTLGLGSSSFQVEQAQRLPGHYQGATVTPIAVGKIAYLCDASGQLVRADLL